MHDAKLTYASAGVDIDAAEDSKHRIKRLVESTFTAGARGAFGGFGGMFRVPEGMRKPLLVASADGVGTKIKIAIEADRHDTIGHCLVNHCVNDILVQGAKPLFFLDYVAFGKLIPSVVEGVVAGVSAGCRENGASLIGGETAEMPGVYTPPDYDLAGFIVGAVEEDEVITSAGVQDGDVLVGLESSGLHTNGYSLARRIVFDHLGLRVDAHVPELGTTIGEALLATHRSYLHVVSRLRDAGGVKGLAHITGGGITDNLPRIFPPGIAARIRRGSWPVPPVFGFLGRSGDVPTDDMYRTFNMGVGMIVACAPADAERLVETARAAGEADAWFIGELVEGDRTITYV